MKRQKKLLKKPKALISVPVRKGVLLHNETVGELNDQLVQRVDMLQSVLQKLPAMCLCERPKLVLFKQTSVLLNTDGEVISGACRCTG